MKLSKELPEKIDVFEYLLPKLRKMTVDPSYKGDARIPEQRFINFLQELSINSEKAQTYDLKIQQWTLKATHEFELLVRRANTFLELYATNYNKYFKATKDYLTQSKRMKNFVAKIYEEFTNTSKRERYKAYDRDFNRINHSAFESSPINSPYVEGTWLDFESLSPEVKLLFSHLQNLFFLLEKMFTKAQMVDELVERMKKDHNRIIEIYNKCKHKKLEEIKLLMGALSLPYLEKVFPEITNELYNTKNFEDFIVKYYHELNDQEFTYVIALHYLILQQHHDIYPDENFLYEDIYDVNTKINLVKRLRIVMKNISTFDIQGRKKEGEDAYLVNPKFIAMLMKDTKIPSGKGKAFTCDYFKNYYKGELIVPQYQAVNKAFGKIDEKSEKFAEFHNKVEKLVEVEKIREEAKNISVGKEQRIQSTPVFSQQNQMMFNALMKH